MPLDIAHKHDAQECHLYLGWHIAECRIGIFLGTRRCVTFVDGVVLRFVLSHIEMYKSFLATGHGVPPRRFNTVATLT